MMCAIVTPMADRPILVTIIGGISMIIGILTLVLGAVALIGVLIPGLTIPAGVGGVAGIIAGLIFVIIGYGFLKGWAIVWYLGVLVYILALLSSAYALVMGATGMVVTVAISLVILLYLFSKKVKTFFLEK